jgi:hypothetical protein
VTDRLLSRAHLEALVVAMAIVRPEARAQLLRRVDRDHASPACWALLEQLAGTTQLVRPTTDGQHALADRAELITIAELLDFSLETLIGLVNALPTRATPPARWERDLARAEASAA